MTHLKSAIVTGASSGIGRAVAVELARRGWALGLVARRGDALEETTVRARDAGAPNVETRTCDVADLGALRGALESLIDALGGVGALVNNAGLGCVVPISETDDALMEQTLRVNTLAPAAAIRAVWEVMQDAGGGRIVNVSSYATDDPFPGFFAYGASKGALDVMSKSIANEGGACGILGFAIAPGAVETAMLRGAFDESIAPKSICLDPEDIARIISDCAAGERDADNGRVIYVRRDDQGTVEIKVQPRMSEL